MSALLGWLDRFGQRVVERLQAWDRRYRAYITEQQRRDEDFFKRH